MEQSAETKKEPRISNKAVIIVVAAAAAVIVAAIAVVTVIILQRNEDVPTSSQMSIGYAAEAKVMLEQNELQAAMDEAMENAKLGNIGLRYQNDAFSTDGTNFECYIVNSSVNKFDMFLTIFTDAELKEQIYLSELVPPGSGFESITLDRSLEKGDHTVYVALTQVDVNEAGEQVILRQVVHTMDFHVS